MSLSKKTRFEVFKRDGFTCGYCGNTPPAVVLEVDHIEPVSKGGSDDKDNLITACFDCNRGKSDRPLDQIPTPLAENVKIAQEKEEQLEAFRKQAKRIRNREKREINIISKMYTAHFEDSELTNSFKLGSVKKFLKSLPLHEVEESMEIALAKKPYDKDDAIRYFCGICWTKIRAKDDE